MLLKYIQQNAHSRFLWGAVDLNTKLRKILKEENLTLQFFNYDVQNLM
jgi:hypothetical protein